MKKTLIILVLLVSGTAQADNTVENGKSCQFADSVLCTSKPMLKTRPKGCAFADIVLCNYVPVEPATKKKQG